MYAFVRLGLVLAVACCLVSLRGLSPVRADGPLIEDFEFVVDHEAMANCGDFQIIADGNGRNRITTFFDGEGNPIRVAFKGLYRGTMTNSITGFHILDAPSVANITLDLVEGTQTNIGAFFTVTIPGNGAILIDAGRLVFEGGSGPPVFIAGPHRPHAESIGILCDALR